MNWRYGIFKLFSIFFNLLLACDSQSVFFQPLDRFQFSNAQFFVLFWGLVAWKKVGPFCLFSAFLGHFPYSLFFFSIFLVFQICNDVRNCSYTFHLKGDVKTFILTNFLNLILLIWSEDMAFSSCSRYFFNLLLACVSQAVSSQPLNRI